MHKTDSFVYFFSALLLAALLFASLSSCSGGISLSGSTTASNETTTDGVSAATPTPTATPAASVSASEPAPTETPSGGETPVSFTPIEPTGEFSVYAMSLGKADCFVLKTENHMMVVDLGVKSMDDEIVDFIKSCGRTVDALMITHYDKDHIGAAKKFFKKFTVASAYLPAYEEEKPENAEEIRDYLTKYEIPQNVVTEKTSFVFDDVSFTILPTALDLSGKSSASNASSLAMLVTHGENVFLFTGDAEGARLTEILGQLPDPSAVDWLKAPHHGSYDGKAASFFGALTPDYAVITSSQDEPADGSVVRALEDAGAQIFYTVKGAVKTTSDGKSLTVGYIDQ